MSRPEQARLSNLELFVLAMVGRGLVNPYELHEGAGLSVGAVIPALKRLEAGQYVRRSTGGARRRQEFALTAKGQRVIGEWRQLLEAPVPGDLDSVLRVACLALLGSDRKAAARFLRQAAERKQHAARGSELKFQELEKPAERDPLGFYAWARARGEVARAKAEASVLLAIAQRLEKAHR